MDGVEVARCALHPERAADAGTCARCGSFMCGACRAPSAADALKLGYYIASLVYLQRPASKQLFAQKVSLASV